MEQQINRASELIKWKEQIQKLRNINFDEYEKKKKKTLRFTKIKLQRARIRPRAKFVSEVEKELPTIFVIC